jgi:hypothetical protein
MLKNIFQQLLLVSIFIFFYSPASAHSGSTAIYIATDKENYVAGERMQFEILVLNQPANSSNTVFVELLDCSGNLFTKKMLPVSAGISWGSIDLPQDKSAAFYLLYCYTIEQDSVETESIKKLILNNTGGNKAEKKASLSYFFEGGSFIAQAPNTLLISCTDENGNGLAATGRITNPVYANTTSFETNEQGFAKITFTPENKIKYSIIANTKELGNVQQDLPLPASSGVNLSVSITDSLLSYSAYSFTANNDELDYKLTVLANNQPVYNASINFQLSLSVIKEDLKLKDFPEGFLTFRLTDNNNKLYAQRIIYNSVDTGGYHFVKIIDTINKRVAETAIPNYVNGNGYINVLLADTATEMHFSGELSKNTGQVQVLKNSTASTVSMNDLLIAWKNLPGSIAPGKMNDHSFLTISGRAYNNDNKPLRNKKINLILLHKNLKKQFLAANTNNTGDFEINNLLFYDSVTVYYQLGGQSEEKNNIRITCKTSPDINSQGKEFHYLNALCAATATRSTNLKPVSIAGTDSLRKDEKTLAELVVKAAKPKTASEEYAEKNISEQHNQSNFARNEFDFIANPPVIDNTPIFQFLRGRIASLIIDISQNGDVKISTNYGGGIGVYLNDMLMDGGDLGAIANLTISDLALVRYYSVALKPRETSSKSKYAGFFGNGGDGGDLMIYTKKDFVPADPKIKTFNKTSIAGYQLELPVRKTEPTPGYPQSLYWKPDYQPRTDQIIYTTLPLGSTSNNIQLIIEGIGNNNIPYSFTKNLVFK